MPNADPMKDLEPDVLIVEDDDALRDALCRTLESDGLKCHSVSRGEHAVAGILKDGWRPRLILLDLMMPGMTGWDFLDLRARTDRLRTIPVIVLSAAADRASSKDLSAEATLKKPVKGEELIAAVRRYL
ncbi:MAG: response regulator [Acidobacteriota bacterium]